MQRPGPGTGHPGAGGQGTGGAEARALYIRAGRGRHTPVPGVQGPGNTVQQGGQAGGVGAGAAEAL